MAKVTLIHEAWCFELDCGHMLTGGMAPDVQEIGDEVDCPVCEDNEKRIKAARVEGMEAAKDVTLQAYSVSGAVQHIDKLIAELEKE